MGNANSMNKAQLAAAAAADGNWANDLDALEVIRRGLKQSGGLKKKSSRNKRGGKDDIDVEEMGEIYQLIRKLKSDEEGKELLKRFVEQQTHLNLDDPSEPPVKSIVIPGGTKTSRAA